MKKPILYSLDLSHLQQSELGAFVTRILTDYNNLDLNSTAEPDFVKLFKALESQSPTYNLGLKQVQAQAETELLLEQDKARDKKLSTLRTALAVYKNTDKDSEKTAYKLLKLVFATYKDVAKENYETESLDLDQFISKLRDSQHLPAVQLLQLESHIDTLEQSNGVFKKTFSTRSTTTNTDVVYNTSKLAKEMIASYRTWAKYVLTMAEVRETPFYDAVYTMNNNVRQYYAGILAKRSGK
jgi:hypothetical protein